MTTKTRSNFRAFLEGYLECALWLATDENGSPVGDDKSIFGDIAFPSLLRVARECKDFVQANLLDISLAAAQLPEGYASAGHDFWLTKNGHGAGYWDRGLGELGDRLSEAAQVYGATNAFEDCDGKIYFDL